MSTRVLEALPGKFDIKRHSPRILYILASLAMSTSVLEALPCKLDIKRHSPSILYISASLEMSTSVLQVLPGKLGIKRHSPSILFIWVSILVLIVCAQKPLKTHGDVSSMARGQNYGLSLHLHPYFVYASSKGSDEYVALGAWALPSLFK